MEAALIYITGDTHNTLDMSNVSGKHMRFCCKKLQADYKRISTVIILGDFGLPWYKCPVDENGIQPTDPTEKYLLKWYKNKPFTILAVMGNHDNYDMIANLPEVEMFGSIVLKVSDNIFYLKRGEVYKFEGKSFLVLGGAMSDDKVYRTPHKSWWKQEELSLEEKEHCIEKIKQYGCSFDYVLSHTGPRKGISVFDDSEIKDTTVAFNDEVEAIISYKKWFFGHWHSDWGFNNYENSRFVPLYHMGIVL